MHKILLVLLLLLTPTIVAKEFRVLYIDRTELKLFRYYGTFPISFPVGIGKKGLDDGITCTPAGKFTITYKAKDPFYRDVGENSEKIKPYKFDKRNKYGTRIIGLSYKREGATRGLAIHGTNEPELVPGYCSNMCIRMKNEHIEVLYEYVEVGDIVIIYN